MQEIWNEFITEVGNTHWLIWTGVAFGVLQVLLAKSNNIWLYPAGIISSSIFIWTFVEGTLYAEAVLNLYYVIMSIYGWWYWTKKKDQPPVPVTYTNKREKLITASIVLLGTPVIWLLLLYLPGLFNMPISDVAFWDALVSANAWAGTWLLARRKIENWILLNISNAIAIPLQLYKHIPLTALLTLFLFIIAVLGYFEWRKIYNHQKANNRS
jgi:nicotinamide mononucleotide transporter